MRTFRQFLCMIFTFAVCFSTVVGAYATSITLDETSIICPNEDKVYISELIPKDETDFLPKNKEEYSIDQNNVSRGATDPGEIRYTLLEHI